MHKKNVSHTAWRMCLTWIQLTREAIQSAVCPSLKWFIISMIVSVHMLHSSTSCISTHGNILTNHWIHWPYNKVLYWSLDAPNFHSLINIHVYLCIFLTEGNIQAVLTLPPCVVSPVGAWWKIPDSTVTKRNCYYFSMYLTLKAISRDECSLFYKCIRGLFVFFTYVCDTFSWCIHKNVTGRKGVTKLLQIKHEQLLIYWRGGSKWKTKHPLISSM